MDFKKIFASFGFVSRDEEEPEDNEDPEISEDEEEEESESLFDRVKRIFGFGRRDEEEDEEEPEEETQEEREVPRPRKKNADRGEGERERRSEPRAAAGTYTTVGGSTQVIRVINVREMKECGDIIKFMHDGEAVLINVERVDPKNCGRVVDLLSGAAYALDGRMIKAAHLAYMLVPKNVKAIETDQLGSAPRYM